jgi:hypothetical protein
MDVTFLTHKEIKCWEVGSETIYLTGHYNSVLALCIEEQSWGTSSGRGSEMAKEKVASNKDPKDKQGLDRDGRKVILFSQNRIKSHQEKMQFAEGYIGPSGC